MSSIKPLIITTLVSIALWLLMVIIETAIDNTYVAQALSLISILITLLLFVHLILIKPINIQQRRLIEYFSKPLTHSLDTIIINREEEMIEVGRSVEKRASELAINSAQVAFFVSQLAQDIEESGGDACAVAAATQQLVANTKEINLNAQMSAQSAKDAQDASRINQKRLEDNIANITLLHNGVENATSKIQMLATNASEIQGITDVIDSIAQQTNLLALNAAIEAARAGDQGRGFAVVADEVRALASKTADATEKIGHMLKDMTQQTHATMVLMDDVSNQTDNVVNVTKELSMSMDNISSLMEGSCESIAHISLALKEQDATSEELSLSISNISAFLQQKSNETQKVSLDATELSQSTESIFTHLHTFKTGSVIEQMCEQAMSAAQAIGLLFEQQVSDQKISLSALFDRDYQQITNTNPPKYSTLFDQLTDQILPAIQEPLLKQFTSMIYAGAVDNNGYFPTHNTKFSKPLTGNYDADVINNRTKRLFTDPTGRRCGAHEELFLLQTYKRDTGEIMHDVSAPIIVNGKHWGGFRIGFNTNLGK